MDSRSVEIPLVTRRSRKDLEILRSFLEPGGSSGSWDHDWIAVPIWEPKDSSLDPEIRFGTRRPYGNPKVIEIVIGPSSSRLTLISKS
ncbi:hypothetical protein F2Q70_00011772 [Brassica cretica]|uniref:Uncharacterized protein n=1 Tax=Brassica cretica TaxID=69181 RepID=A0A3N6T312_BRACR|nr:hypothetical protein F2Q70_00011772 [Brassica cretica]KAF3545442.1 hypothetical protein DY000_02007242 [Brassica cretica]